MVQPPGSDAPATNSRSSPPLRFLSTMAASSASYEATHFPALARPARFPLVEIRPEREMSVRGMSRRDTTSRDARNFLPSAEAVVTPLRPRPGPEVGHTACRDQASRTGRGARQLQDPMMKTPFLVSTSGVAPCVPARSWQSPAEASVSSAVLGLGSREGRVLPSCGQHPQTRKPAHH